MSDLIDRYLAAVAALLPKSSRQDIVAELRDLVMNRVEEREERLGRPLDKADTEALLREIGHPIAVAGRYGQSRALIGPEIFPFWWFAVKVLLAIAAVAAVVPAVVVVIAGHGEGQRIGGILGDFIPSALSLIGAATVVAAAIERGWIKIGDLAQWKASELPHVPQGQSWSQGKGGFAKSRFEGVFELAAVALFIAWWTHALPFPTGRSHGDEVMAITFNPIFQALYWPILALALVQVASSLILVIKPGWVRGRAGAELVCALGGLALSAVLWSAQPLVSFVARDASHGDFAELQRTVDLGMVVVMVVIIAINVTKLFVDGWRLIRGR